MSVTGQGKGWDVLDSQDRARFEQLVLPHLDAAFNLSRWLLRSRADAEDVAQEAMLRSFRFFGVLTAATRELGYCRSSAILAIRGWRRIAKWNS
jgi:DNA-directed RNA polymerase specialized sigma24 family protein